jgi:hypothetical protein
MENQNAVSEFYRSEARAKKDCLKHAGATARVHNYVVEARNMDGLFAPDEAKTMD